MSASLSELLPPPKRPLQNSLTSVPSRREDSKTKSATPRRKRRWSSVSKETQLSVEATDNALNSVLVPATLDATALYQAKPSYGALTEKSFDEEELRKPSQEETDEVVQRTRAALENRLERKIASAKPNSIGAVAKDRQVSYVRYTPANLSRQHNSGASQRIIKMVSAPVDPMEPSRFRQKKAVPDPPSPEAPVLHSPRRKASKKELDEWKIPPCVSNWKNNHGYTIPLDKRLAADGRDLRDNRINDRFASFAESLYIAEKTARVEVETRAKVQRKKALKEKEAQEAKLRVLAAKAREERAELRLAFSSGAPQEAGLPGSPPRDSNVSSTAGSPPFYEDRRRGRDRGERSRSRMREGEEEDDDEEVRRRDMIREERRREREHEFRRREIHNDGDNTGPTLKRSKLTRDRDRDISERLALGQQVGAGGAQGEVMYDQRLFNQTSGGLSAGFGPDDAYTVYDKPLFGRNASKFQFTKGSGEDTMGKFQPAQGFQGLPETNASKSGAARSEVVEFELEDDPGMSHTVKHTEKTRQKEDADLFGVDKFLDAAKEGR